MDKKTLFAIATLILLGGAFASYLFWQYNHPKPEIGQVISTPPPPAPPPRLAVSQVIETPPPPVLPSLAKSDDAVLDALAGLVGDKTLMKLFHPEQVIRNIVATIDNLPQQRVSANIMPFKPATGKFVTVGSEEHLTIGPKNADRYTSYVRIAKAIDARKLIEIYASFYPLFQQAYEELGYPNKNFNDQLLETIDDLLDTPDIKGPVKLVQPKYFYLYADPDIEALSIGQKIMIRLGSKNAKIVKNKLLEIKQELALHLQDLKTGKAP